LNPQTREVDVYKMRQAITKNTCMVSNSKRKIQLILDKYFFKLVGSAPNFPHGVIDPIEDISKVLISIIFLLNN